MRRALLTLALLMLCAQAACAEVYFGEPPADWAQREVLEWTAFDVNAGDAMLLRCGGESMLVDGGLARYGERLAQMLAVRGVSGVDRMLFTHMHDDHAAGLIDLLKSGFPAHELLHGYSDTALRQDEYGQCVLQIAQAQGLPMRRIGEGDALTLGGARIAVYQSDVKRNANARSLVLHVTFGDCALLLCADISGVVQHDFADRLPEGAMRAQVIKMPHHSLTPAVPEFLDAVTPSVAVVTNRSRDVASKAAHQFEQRALTALFCGDGSVTAVTDGTDWYIRQSEDGE